MSDNRCRFMQSVHRYDRVLVNRQVRRFILLALSEPLQPQIDMILNEFDLEAEWDELVAELGALASSIPATPSINDLIRADQQIVINIDNFLAAFVPPTCSTSYPNYLP